MKEHNYMKHIYGNGVSLDKLQEGDFRYDDRATGGTLSEFAKKVRETVNEMTKKKEKG